jgi:hypothetical protein
LLLQISGFATEQDAVDFCPVLRTALRIAALGSHHSITPSDAVPVTSSKKQFDRNVPTVTLTQAGLYLISYPLHRRTDFISPFFQTCSVPRLRRGRRAK